MLYSVIGYHASKQSHSSDLTSTFYFISFSHHKGLHQHKNVRTAGIQIQHKDNYAGICAILVLFLKYINTQIAAKSLKEAESLSI